MKMDKCEMIDLCNQPARIHDIRPQLFHSQKRMSRNTREERGQAHRCSLKYILLQFRNVLLRPGQGEGVKFGNHSLQRVFGAAVCGDPVGQGGKHKLVDFVQTVLGAEQDVDALQPVWHIRIHNNDKMGRSTYS